eukprot:gene8167-biopygen2642
MQPQRGKGFRRSWVDKWLLPAGVLERCRAEVEQSRIEAKAGGLGLNKFGWIRHPNLLNPSPPPPLDLSVQNLSTFTQMLAASVSRIVQLRRALFGRHRDPETHCTKLKYPEP